MSKLLETAFILLFIFGSARMALAGDLAPAALDADVAQIRNEWGRIKYQVTDKNQQARDIAALETQAERLIAAYPDRAEPKIWDAIILATDAGISKGLSALPKVKKAKTLLEEALKEDDKAIDGSAYTTLGSLYYQVPGWPVGFGDDDKAEKALKTALSVNPDGMDPNFFYGDFLLHRNDSPNAIKYLRHALAAAPRPGYETIDAGRRNEINQAIAKAEKMTASAAGNRYN